MIDTSLCHNPAWNRRLGHAMEYLEHVFGSMAAMQPAMDASGGRLFRAATSSGSRVYVTSYFYDAGNRVQYINVMLSRDHFRVAIGYEGDKAVRIEKIDAQLAQARSEADRRYYSASKASNRTAAAEPAPDNVYVGVNEGAYAGVWDGMERPGAQNPYQKSPH